MECPQSFHSILAHISIDNLSVSQPSCRTVASTRALYGLLLPTLRAVPSGHLSLRENPKVSCQVLRWFSFVGRQVTDVEQSEPTALLDEIIIRNLLTLLVGNSSCRTPVGTVSSASLVHDTVCHGPSSWHRSSSSGCTVCWDSYF